MKKGNRLLVLTVAALLTGGCSYTPMPVAKNFPYSEQRIMQAAHHWEVLAADISQKIYRKLNAENISQPARPIANPVALEPVAPAQLLPAPATAPAQPNSSPNIVTFTPSSTEGYANSASADPNAYGTMNVYQGVQPQTGYSAQSSGGFQPVASSGIEPPSPLQETAPSAIAASAPYAADPGFSNFAPLMAAPSIPPIFLAKPHSNEPVFKQAFYNLLRTHLISNDLTVVNRLDGPYSSCYAPDVPCRSLMLEYDINVVQHKDPSRPDRVRFPGAPTANIVVPAALAGAAGHLIENGKHLGEKAWAVIPILGLLTGGFEAKRIKDLYFPNELPTEVVISTTISDGDFVVFSDSNIYYIRAGDQDQYHKHTRTYKVVSQ